MVMISRRRTFAAALGLALTWGQLAGAGGPPQLDGGRGIKPTFLPLPPPATEPVRPVAMQPGDNPESLPKPKANQPESLPHPRAVPDGALLPIDLVSALRLADTTNPTIAFAQARARAARARLDLAAVLWLPDLSLGATYYRLDGQTQNQRGEVFTTSRHNLNAGEVAALRFETSDAIFLPLVARRLADSVALDARATRNNVSLEVALAYLDLVQVHGLLAVNADTLARAQQMLDRAKAADEAGLSKTRADVNRAETEVALRQQERIELRGRVGVASARLTRLLLLDPTVDLVPAEPTVVPVTLVDPTAKLSDLVAVAQGRRPELGSNQAAVAAAEASLKQAAVAPFVPRVLLQYGGGAFGGGRNDEFNDFNSRGEGTAGLYWELSNLGFGDLARVKERAALLEQGQYRGVELRAQVAAEVTEAAKVAAARKAALDVSERAVREAVEMYRKLLDTQFGMVGARPQFDALEPLTAIQMLNQARVQYLTQVIDYNRAQFRLFWAMGQPTGCALPGEPQSLALDPVPDRPGFTPEPPKKDLKESPKP